MAALPIKSMREWEYTVTVAPAAGKAEDKITYFLSGPMVNGKTVYKASPAYIMDTTRVAFAVRPGALNDKSPEKLAPNTTLNADLDVPESAATALREFDETLHAKVAEALEKNSGEKLGPLTWHSVVHPARQGSGYADTITFRVGGWTEFVGTVHSRPLTYMGNTRAVPGSVTWLPRSAKTQPLREKETAFYRYGKVNAETGAYTYRAQATGGQLVCPDSFPAGTMVRLVFSVSHVLLTVKARGTPSSEVHGSVIFTAKEVYEQPRFAASASAGVPLMPGVTFEDEEEEGGNGGFTAVTTGSSGASLAASPATKRARME